MLPSRHGHKGIVAVLVSQDSWIAWRPLGARHGEHPWLAFLPLFA
jgi:hypothetical protein